MRTSFYLNPKDLCKLLVALCRLLAFLHSACSLKDNLVKVFKNGPSKIF